jgi:hypothetical protein
MIRYVALRMIRLLAGMMRPKRVVYARTGTYLLTCSHSYWIHRPTGETDISPDSRLLSPSSLHIITSSYCAKKDRDAKSKDRRLGEVGDSGWRR